MNKPNLRLVDAAVVEDKVDAGKLLSRLLGFQVKLHHPFVTCRTQTQNHEKKKIPERKILHRGRALNSSGFSVTSVKTRTHQETLYPSNAPLMSHPQWGGSKNSSTNQSLDARADEQS